MNITKRVSFIGRGLQYERIKRITSIVLALAMFATGIAISGPTTVKADTATDNWKANGIVSPKRTS